MYRKILYYVEIHLHYFFRRVIEMKLQV